LSSPTPVNGGTALNVSGLFAPSLASHDNGWLAVSDTKKPTSMQSD